MRVGLVSLVSSLALLLVSSETFTMAQSAPFCGEAQSDGSVKGSLTAKRTLTMDGDGNLLITDETGKKLGFDGGKFVVTGQPVATLGTDQSITFTPVFTAVKGHTYTVTAIANEPNGHTEQRSAAIRVL